jgi:putative exosortase-associated protein (TIGR04073 family)
MKFISILAVLIAFSAPVQAADDIGSKLTRGVSNTAFGWFDIGREVAIRSNKDGLLYGVVVGIPVGVLFSAGRTLSGVIDLITFPIPTQQFVTPTLPWQDFNRESTFRH